MSGQAMQFLIQMAPIALGALFVMALKVVKFPEQGVEVRFSPDLRDDAVGESEKCPARAKGDVANLPVRCTEAYVANGLSGAVASYLSPASQVGASPWHGYVGSSDDMRDGIFERLVHDELITLGVFSSDTGLRSSRNAAFDLLGILDERKADNLSRYLMRQKKERLRLFAVGNPAPLARTLSFEGESGLLLAYLAGYDLEVIGE